MKSGQMKTICRSAGAENTSVAASKGYFDCDVRPISLSPPYHRPALCVCPDAAHGVVLCFIAGAIIGMVAVVIIVVVFAIIIILVPLSG
jgi:hypothetical protein